MVCKIISETVVKSKIGDAINCLAPNFNFKNNSINMPKVVIAPLRKNTYATMNGADCVLTFDLEQFLSDTSQTDQQGDMFNLIIGEESAHYLDFNSSEELYKYSLPESSVVLKFVGEVIGHYGGLIYSNRNGCAWKFFGFGVKAKGIAGQAYKLADKIFDSYREFRLEEIAKIKNLANRYNKIKELTGESR